VLPVVIAVVVLIVVLVLLDVYFYNGLVKLKNKVEAAWAQIDVQLTRRAELIPNLVETVKGYAAHERATLDAVVSARTSALAADGPRQKAEAEHALTGALKSVFALAEAYPDLKANQSFLDLQETLTATEDKIAYARQFYNDAVNAYNTKIETVPWSAIARRFRFSAREYFEAGGEARGPVAVEF
jgi:LemA protein